MRALPAVLLLALPSPAEALDAPDFATEVLPLLRERCFECHGPGPRIRGGLRLTGPEALAAGGTRGPVIDAEHPADSLLLEMTSYAREDTRMPPSGPLPADEADVLRRWVLAGAPWDPSVVIEVEPLEPAHGAAHDDGMRGWSYRPLTRPAVPRVQHAEGVANPIDAFVLARLEQLGLEPSPPASRATLLRRLSYDLVGLPPTPEEIDAFVADPAPDATDRAIERLLASDQYGVQQARAWLDLVRYADTNGFERDNDKPYMWRYRDYVVDAMNADLPYDRFVLEQLAGDELADATPSSRTATGFLRLMMWDDEPPMGPLQARYDVLDDIVRTTSETFLGMTMGCARCHDHKGDPVTQDDYYSFMAFFHGLSDYRTEGTLVSVMSPAEQAEYDAQVAAHDRERADVLAELAALERRFQERDAHSSATVGDLVDVRYRFYRDTWQRLPDFDALRHEDAGTLAGGRFDLSPASRDEAFGFAFDALLPVTEPGDYRFRLDADDGARLALDGATVLDHDGIHALGDPREATVSLDAGAHPVRLDYFQAHDARALHLAWGPADDDRWAYRFDDPPVGWQDPVQDDSTWAHGPGGFGTEGTPGAVVGTTWDGPEIYLRRTFEWTGEDASDLVLVWHHDEEVRVYLNGVPAASAGGYLTGYEACEVSDEARAAVRPGRNLLAVYARNTRGGQYVHVRPVHRADLAHTRPQDLAFGLRALTASSAGAAREELREALAARGAVVLGADDAARYAALQERDARLARGPAARPKQANVATETGPYPAPLHVHLRGNPAAPGAEVTPHFPRCLAPPETALRDPGPDGATSLRRLALAEWIASPANPLTARVIANRVWQHHFGRGIVPTPSDFGELGERPTHPELLDWLACELIDSGWSLKALHRLVLSSNTYRQAYRPAGPDEADRDPENRLLWRARLRRLTAEELRDAALAVDGRLNPELGGPGFYSLVPEEALATSSKPDEVWGTSPDRQRARRSAYIKVKRSLLTPLLASFDFPDTDSPCAARFVTTQPGQALALLNGEFLHRSADALAARVAAERPGDLRAQIERALRLALGRHARGDELDAYLAFHTDLQRDFALAPDAALRELCLAVLNLNEFVYLD